MASSRKLRWGILGVATINDRLLPAFAAARNAELAAIASRSIDKARNAARSAGIPVAHGSYEALLDDPTVDAVYNPLPNSLHAEWTRRAADRGKHVLCEKPLTPTAPEAAELVDYCRQKRVKLMDGFMWPHHPRTAEIRRLIDLGEIGQVERVCGSFTFLLRPLDPDNIRLQPALGGGSLLDVGCYPVFGIRWAMSAEPERVAATATYSNDVDVSMSGMLLFSDGRVGLFDCGFTYPMRQRLEITGTEGVIRVEDMWQPHEPAAFTIQHGENVPELVKLDASNQIVRMIEGFGDAVLADRDPQPLPNEAVRTLRVLDALTRSAREGREIPV